MRFIIAMLLVGISLFVIRAKSTYQLLNCVIRGATGSGSRKAVMPSRHYRSAFVMSLHLSVGVLLSVSLPAHSASVVTNSVIQTDTLHYCNNMCVFTKNILFPKASAVVLQDFANNGATIDSIRQFFSVTASQNLLNIKVTGSYSPEGEYAFNKNLAEARASALGRLVRDIAPGVNPETSINHPAAGQACDYRSLRSAELQIVYRNIASVGPKMCSDTTGRQETIVSKHPLDNALDEIRETDTISSTTPPTA